MSEASPNRRGTASPLPHLHSRLHRAWANRIGNNLGTGDQNRYNKTYTFETFPFPAGLTPDIPADNYADDPRAQAIAEAARELNEKREAWLNPPDLVRREPEVVAGYPERILPVDDAAVKELKKRTLTNLYNKRPAWLAGLHDRLDAAVAAAYGWPAETAPRTYCERETPLSLSICAHSNTDRCNIIHR